MTREGTRLSAAIAIAVLAAGLLSACGGGSSSSSSSTDSSSTAASTGSSSTSDPSTYEATSKAESAKNRSGGDGPKSSQGGGDGGKSSGGGSGQGGSGGGGSGGVATPLKVSGGGAEQFIVKGGDNSVQEFGEEAGESELQEAAEATHAFFVARAEGDWTGACSRMAKSLVEQVEGLAASSTEIKNKDCASFLEAFTTNLSPATWREVTTVNAGSLRREGEQGFLVYFGASNTIYSMPMKQEGGAWKVSSLSGSALN